ncbi:MAG: hypothetical protein M3R25_07485 [Bacteroidota bacterium]|nr:hypothetical protein [Bacteroidota bacterium]
MLMVLDAGAQSSFGLEITRTQFVNYNAGMLIGSGGISWYRIDREQNTMTSSTVISLVYQLDSRHLFKIGIGRHQNGRKLDVSTYEDLFGGNPLQDFTNVSVPYEYLQISTSYSHSLPVRKKVFIPLEFGFNCNKRILEKNIFIVGISKYNFDLTLSTGLDYSITPQLWAGLHGVYNHSITEYQDKYEQGSLRFRQLGVEVSIIALFSND